MQNSNRAPSEQMSGGGLKNTAPVLDYSHSTFQNALRTSFRKSRLNPFRLVSWAFHCELWLEKIEKASLSSLAFSHGDPRKPYGRSIHTALIIETAFEEILSPKTPVRLWQKPALFLKRMMLTRAWRTMASRGQTRTIELLEICSELLSKHSPSMARYQDLLAVVKNVRNPKSQEAKEAVVISPLKPQPSPLAQDTKLTVPSSKPIPRAPTIISPRILATA
jgi:hypothetical protein